MRWRSRCAVSPYSFLLAAALTFLSACGVVESGPNYRYRLTVEVDTPQGLRSGSSVIAVKCGAVRLPAVGGAGCHARGEAVAVDLPDGRILFALLRGTEDVDLANYLASTPIMPTSNRTGLSRDQQWQRRAAFLSKPREVPRNIKGGPTGNETVDNYPMLATFEKLNDPASAKILDLDRLHMAFGYNIIVKQITVQLTDDNVSTKIQRIIPWIKGRLVKDPSLWLELPYESRIVISGLQKNIK